METPKGKQCRHLSTFSARAEPARSREAFSSSENKQFHHSEHLLMNRPKQYSHIQAQGADKVCFNIFLYFPPKPTFFLNNVQLELTYFI